MSVVAACHYVDGTRVGTVGLEQPPVFSQSQGDCVWIGLHEPSEDELRALQTGYGLHPLAVEDALKAHQMPKVDIYGDQLFIVARTAHLEGDEIAYGETAIFVGRHHIITVRHGSARAHTALRCQLEAATAQMCFGVDYVLHGVLDFIVDGYFPIVETIEEDVLSMEHHMLNSILSRADVTRIFDLRRQLTRFQRMLGPMSELCRKLVHLDLPCLDAEAKPYFNDVFDHARRAEAMALNLRDSLSSVFETSHLFEQQRQGAITRQLAAWAAILAVPTAIAGIYGMNFEHMPELKTQYGYYVILGVIAVLCTGLFVRFKRSGWL